MNIQNNTISPVSLSLLLPSLCHNRTHTCAHTHARTRTHARTHAHPPLHTYTTTPTLSEQVMMAFALICLTKSKPTLSKQVMVAFALIRLIKSCTCVASPAGKRTQTFAHWKVGQGQRRQTPDIKVTEQLPSGRETTEFLLP